MGWELGEGAGRRLPFHKDPRRFESGKTREIKRTFGGHRFKQGPGSMGPSHSPRTWSARSTTDNRPKPEPHWIAEAADMLLARRIIRNHSRQEQAGL